jgi:DNA ligase-1
MVAKHPTLPRRELLQLAHTYKPAKHTLAGRLISEKLDGTRCFWDGGLSRGVPTCGVPWAGVINPKTGDRKAKVKPVATGLWSRYGNPIIAPDWFLDLLPCCPLDGELWAGRGNFQLCRSICAGDAPDPRFDQIKYAAYSTPSLPYIFADGEIKNPNMRCVIRSAEVESWVANRLAELNDFVSIAAPASFADELAFLDKHIPSEDPRVFLHQQSPLSDDEDEARAEAYAFLEDILDQGGEGVVLRDPQAPWLPKRNNGSLKYKPFDDSEGTIVGFVAGKKGKQGNVLGKIGTLRMCWRDVEFEIGTGLSMPERELLGDRAFNYAVKHPGEILPDWCDGKHLKRGQTITFKYRELSDSGVPKEGRFWRRRDGVE